MRRRATTTLCWAKSAMLIPSTVTARNSGFNRRPLHAGQGRCIISRSISCFTQSESVSR